MQLMRVGLILGFTLALSVHAAVEVYDFTSDEGYARYQSLTYELRCPKCQNQNIADSNADIAKDLRREVHRLIEEGQSDDQIVDYMVTRYGDFVRYKPPFNTATLILWVGPAVLALCGVGGLFWLGRRRRQRQIPNETSLSQDEQARLDDLLSDHESKK
ncbi:MAG: cytochrome c-type biogenesis protein CcmH [Hahellaceae bacterium]|nr:cytochrome c-type biogenesis protein CcmH [Hahellaceae bacterium]